MHGEKISPEQKVAFTLQLADVHLRIEGLQSFLCKRNSQIRTDCLNENIQIAENTRTNIDLLLSIEEAPRCVVAQGVLLHSAVTRKRKGRRQRIK